ncbi:recQ-mediated genome instability protein 1-like [Aricia agestis]|uniref:recQ-mediated genome instability protein 1-like n=1 Tax=Aricia agestis TaxID=91739 RepID=UPI001C20C107|nr:recQ-mediated genome instability protein 1-like [Aricia agestis]
MSNDLIDTVRNYLASHHMFVVDEWLSGFIEYFTEENGTSNIREIQNCAREQWLLNNLSDICPGSLPANINNQHKHVLSGKFVLQINAAVDIGTPAYQQYLKLKKVNMENVEATINYEDKVPSHRMMKLYMTDGKQEISGIEYKPMRNISCDITPGCKVMIKGPVECRRGVILLTEANVELLGGEVEDIVRTNSLHGILAAKFGSLNLPEPDANVINIGIRNPTIPHIDTARNNNNQFNSHSNSSVELRNLNAPHIDTVRNNDAQFNLHSNSSSEPPPANFGDDDIDFEQIEALEAQFTDNPVKRPMLDDNPKPEKKLKITPEPANTVDDYPNEDDLFQDEDDYFRDMEADLITHEQANPFVQIKDIISLPEERRKGKVYKIKGQIMRLLSKLSVGKDGWSLRCTIVDDNDDSSSLDVEFTSDVLSEVVGYTPQEMNQIKKQMATQPELKEKAVLALEKAKDTLQLKCVIELTMMERPTITKFTPLEELR